jgi:cytochrome c-type biogenesis protein CcmE
MKKTHIVLIIIIALGIGSMFTLLGNSSTYADFKQANESTDEVHVAGTWIQSKGIEYNPEVDPNRCSFYMKDRAGNEKHVVLLKSKPQDFERSQQVVIVGKINGNDFVANDILMKCPSKYNNGQVAENK